MSTRILTPPVITGPPGPAGGSTGIVVAQSSNFNLAATDAGKEYHVNSVGAVECLIRSQANHVVPLWSYYTIVRMGSGAVSVRHELGNIPFIVSPYDYVTLARTGDAVRLIYLGSDIWHMTGGLA